MLQPNAFGWEKDWLTRKSHARSRGSFRLRVKPVEVQACQHDAADMRERSKSLQHMNIVWAACFLMFSAKLQNKQCSACASMAALHGVLKGKVHTNGERGSNRACAAREVHDSCWHNKNQTPRRNVPSSARSLPVGGRSIPLLVPFRSRLF